MPIHSQLGNLKVAMGSRHQRVTSLHFTYMWVPGWFTFVCLSPRPGRD